MCGKIITISFANCSVLLTRVLAKSSHEIRCFSCRGHQNQQKNKLTALTMGCLMIKKILILKKLKMNKVFEEKNSSFSRCDKM